MMIWEKRFWYMRACLCGRHRERAVHFHPFIRLYRRRTGNSSARRGEFSSPATVLSLPFMTGILELPSVL